MGFWVLLALLPLFISALTIRLSRPLAETVGLTDQPGGRKQHVGALPLTGGLGIVVGFLLLQPFLPLQEPVSWAFYAGMLLLFSCGVYDDARDMSSHLKLGIQVLAALILAVWGVQLGYLGEYPVLGEVTLSTLSIPLTVFAVIALVNAVNMLDGIDGLAGGLSAVMLFWLAVIAVLQGRYDLLVLMVVLASALAGFLLYNLRHPWRSRASVFMGDAGSMVLGFVLAWFAIDLAQSPQAFISPVAFLWILAVPLLDMFSLAVRRMRRRQHPFAPDREHLHHIFLRAGFSAGSTTMILAVAALMLGFVGVFGALVGIPDLLLLLGLVVVVLFYSLYISFAWRTSKALRRLYKGTARGLYVGHRPWWRREATESLPRVWTVVALVGLYVTALSFALWPVLAALGVLAVLVATVAIVPRIARELRTLPLFWLSVGLTLYLLLRALWGGSLLAEGGWRIVLMAGLVGVPLGWWLVRMRWHWPWLLGALGLGALAAFVQAFSWSEWGTLSALDARVRWQDPGFVGMLAGVALMAWVAMLFSGLQRLGSGWRAMVQVGLSLSLSVMTVMVLLSTAYSTAWLGVLVGLGCYALASQILGRPDGHRLGGIGVLSVLVLLGTGVFAWYGLVGASAGPWASFGQMVEAWVAVLRGTPELAMTLHAGVAERGLLWQHLLQVWGSHPWLGNGAVVPVLPAELSGYTSYQTFVGQVLAGFGVVGLAGFVVLVLWWLRALLMLGMYRAWPSSWVLGSCCSLAFLAVMMVFTMPVLSGSALIFMIILSAFFWAAVLEYRLVCRSTSPTNSFPVMRSYKNTGEEREL